MIDFAVRQTVETPLQLGPPSQALFVPNFQQTFTLTHYLLSQLDRYFQLLFGELFIGDQPSVEMSVPAVFKKLIKDDPHEAMVLSQSPTT